MLPVYGVTDAAGLDKGSTSTTVPTVIGFLQIDVGVVKTKCP